MTRRIMMVAFSLTLLLAGCTSNAEPSISTTEANQIAARNRSSEAHQQAKANDARAASQTGHQFQATDDHVTSATAAAAAVKQVLNEPQDQLFNAVPSVNVDAHGHHYYQVDAFTKTTKGQRGPYRVSYFVYLGGNITTKQLN